jgi:hypothetical protein
MRVTSLFRAVSRLLLAAIPLTVLGVASARANQTGAPSRTGVPPVPPGLTIEDRQSAPSSLALDPRSSILDPQFEAASLPEFHSNLVGPEALAFFFPPITVPPRPIPEPPPPVTPHLPPPPGNPPPPPVDHAPEPATLISSALGAGLLGLYSLRRRWRKSSR